MGKTKVAVKIKGSPKQVLKALHTITNTEPSAPAPSLREADFRSWSKKQGKAQ